MSVLDKLREMSIVVADTGDVRAVRDWNPVDCTTNPTLVLKALEDPNSDELISQEVERAHRTGLSPRHVCENLTVAIGAELSGSVSGRVSTEVDACLSFNVEKSVERARQIIAGYNAIGVDKERVLIKLAATWEGIKAAEILQDEGIDCNLTLVFCLPQAVACASAGAFLISPFVGRITDWHKANGGLNTMAPEEDPGVQSVRNIYDYYKSNGVDTIVMAASFRTTSQIKALSGCDRLTIAPHLLEEMSSDTGDLVRALDPSRVTHREPLKMDETRFRWLLNSDAMATEKLAQGIRNFDADHRQLVNLIADRMKATSTRLL
ncbi:transaldolase [Roseibium sp.]|uniref:transaldolase n=1 Tax=Roseibium sp. TaxID=1936156 RepID=UPI00345B9108